MIKEENIDILLLNILRGCATEQEISFFSVWVQDEKNSNYFNDIKEVWAISDSLLFDIPVSQTGREQYQNRIRKDKNIVKRRRFVLASASITAILLTAYFIVAQPVEVNQQVESREIIAETKAPVKVVSNEITITSSSADGNVLKVTEVSDQIIKNNNIAQVSDTLVSDVEINTLFVPKGKRIQVILSDGTKMWVNSDSKVIYPAVFAKDKRVLEVIGNVYFEVKKDKTRPFEVMVNGIKTTALGTQFEVNNYEGLQCSIALVEGLIQVENASSKFVVSPNNQVVMRVGSDKLIMSKFDTKICGLWRENILVIDNEPIASIVEKLNRWHNIEIENRTFGLDKINFTGKLNDATLNEHLEIISDNIKIKFIKEDEKMIIWN